MTASVKHKRNSQLSARWKTIENSPQSARDLSSRKAVLAKSKHVFAISTSKNSFMDSCTFSGTSAKPLSKQNADLLEQNSALKRELQQLRQDRDGQFGFLRTLREEAIVVLIPGVVQGRCWRAETQ